MKNVLFGIAINSILNVDTKYHELLSDDFDTSKIFDLVYNCIDCDEEVVIPKNNGEKDYTDIIHCPHCVREFIEDADNSIKDIVFEIPNVGPFHIVETLNQLKSFSTPMINLAHSVPFGDYFFDQNNLEGNFFKSNMTQSMLKFEKNFYMLGSFLSVCFYTLKMKNKSSKYQRFEKKIVDKYKIAGTDELTLIDCEYNSLHNMNSSFVVSNTLDSFFKDTNQVSVLDCSANFIYHGYKAFDSNYDYIELEKYSKTSKDD